MAGEDYVQVQLTEAGQQMTGGPGGTIQVTQGHANLLFKAGEGPQRVTRAYEWSKVLAPIYYHGKPAFEVVTAPPVPAPVPAPLQPPVPESEGEVKPANEVKN